MKQHCITIRSLAVSNDLPLVLIAGPCAIESRNHALEISHALSEITGRLGIGFIYKSSFDKANRTSLFSGRGVGMREGLAILADVRETVGCPVLTDVHAPEQCREAAEAVNVLQIPAFLCRQTDLLVAAARTGRPVNIKKGQFLAPWDMVHVADKLVQSGNRDVMLCERGASFGYNTLVSDMRALPILAGTGLPVVFDATHSVQQPGGRGESSGGQREFVEVLARAAVAIGVAGIFIETHQDPDKAPSDGPNMMPLQMMPRLLETLLAFDHLAKNVSAACNAAQPLITQSAKNLSGPARRMGGGMKLATPSEGTGRC
ncbi:MAG: 3-deoxy-8-phosphooctulonate synthase [Mesorhizobium sp.]|uniref:3-deoxy-8-phosphooctulonate synthase n=1 Tax=Mesorhizobium sp. TaxID=1871066 RepID=UPI000FE601E7|nr:3-deoxy-8-phosphooctulonate synthase [Mesorhizobium sp.]RWO22461.1 MAG: 3-deoxy-8-phosphooctulonate synthase [Mesorhizobium sp.]